MAKVKKKLSFNTLDHQHLIDIKGHINLLQITIDSS